MISTETGIRHRIRTGWMDLVVFVFLAGVVFGVTHVAQEWRGGFRQAVNINLSIAALPEYTLFTFARGMSAYLLSLAFSIGYAYWAHYDKTAARFLLPLLDILQSIPVLGFLPGVVLALVYLFPRSNVGLELACVLMIFTAQAWNMTFSFYDSLRTIPEDLIALTEFYGFSRWQRFISLELPAGVKGLVYNSMVSMAGGWFFLTVEEAFTLGKDDFRLPGLGSYMSVALANENKKAEIYGIIAMVLMIVLIDQLLWRPLVVWSQKFKLEDTVAGPAETSWLLDWLGHSRVWRTVRRYLSRRLSAPKVATRPKFLPQQAQSFLSRVLYWLWTGFLIMAFLYLCGQLFHLLAQVSKGQWALIGSSITFTFIRVMAAVTLSTLWTIPVGIWIGLNPKWAKILQPVIQIAASFPAPMIFPIILGVVLALHGNLQTGAVLLMMLGTQWYVLFNVVAGASAIPQDFIACAEIFSINGWNRWRYLLLPGIFPLLVTGWITAAGGAWNSSIVAEYVMYQDKPMVASGIGALITQATADGNFPVLAASVMVMSIVVVTLNRSLWKKLYAIANDRFKLII